jgi:Spy/CpxP family protein refolding chaperone
MNESTAKRKAAFWISVVFVLGLALGGVFGYFYGHRSVVMAGSPPLSEPERRARSLDRMTHELGLNDSQRQQIDALMLQIHNEYKSIHDKDYAQFETDMDQARQKGRDQMRAILTPEQKPKFEELLKHIDEERKKNGPPPLAPPPPSR